MALPSTYHLHHSLPNRSPTQRPLSLSLSDYQPLNFDREATEHAYQQSLSVPESSTVSSYSGHSQTDLGGSAETGETSGISTLSHHLKPGDNPHGSGWEPPPNLAGLGRGHALTPPGSPLHSSAARQNQAALSPVLQSPLSPSTPPSNYFDRQYHTPRRQLSPQSGQQDIERGFSAMNMRQDSHQDGYTSDPGGPGLFPRSNRRRRSLPSVPSDVPTPAPPSWEPDYKPQIPPELIAASVENAYASLSAPPPNLPPRRTNAQASSSRQGASTGLARAAAEREGNGGPSMPIPSRSGSRFMAPPPPESPTTPRAAMSGASLGSPQSPPIGRLPDGAPDFPPSEMPKPDKPQKPHRTAPIEQGVNLVANDEKAIWSTHYIDPHLRNPIVSMPSQITNVTNMALSGLASGEKQRYNSTTGAPIDGMAKLARSWFVAPDAKFTSEYGGIELSLAVVDGSSEEQWGSDKGRKKARIEVLSRQGGIRIDMLEVEHNRQFDMKVETKSGDVLVLLPDNYLGPIHVTAGAKPPTFLPILEAQLKPVVRPYQDFYSTFVVPLAYAQDPTRNSNIEHTGMKHVQKWVPEFLREEDEYLDQATGGLKSHTRGELNKLDIRSGKGRVVVGFRDSLDEQASEQMGLKVGHREGGKRKHWWR